MRRDYEFKTIPYPHQETAFNVSRDEKEFALLMDMGTGKSKVIIDTAAWQYQNGRITALVVVAPNGVHQNWIDNELPAHMPDWTQYRAAAWSSTMTVAERRAFDALFTPGDGLRVIAMNVEAFGRGGVKGKAGKALRAILNSFPTLLAIDESTRIKSPGAGRSATLMPLGKHAKMRRIATGSPVVNRPLDVYQQFKFLGAHLLGFGDYESFRCRYAEWDTQKNWKTGKEYQTLRSYTRLDELHNNIYKHSYRVTKDQCLKLPPKQYLPPRTFSMTAEQQRIYNELREKSIATLPSGSEAIAKNVLVRLLKLQQVTCGYVSTDAEEPVESLFADPRDNPRIKAMLQHVEECQGKVIIWSRFVRDIETIKALLEEEYPGEGVVTYYGAVKDADRVVARERFQGERALRDADGNVIGKEPIPPHEQARFFVGQPHSGGIGLTLTAAHHVLYYSNDYSLEARLQSEDRPHRIGLEHSVDYCDLLCPGTGDAKIIKALVDKKELADIITGDNARTWL